MNGRTTIYALRDPQTNELRYIGKTVSALNQRLSKHIWESLRCRDHRSNWIRSLGSAPIIQELMSIPNEMGSTLEIYAIATYRSLGYMLTNLSAGGEGALGVKFTLERLANMSTVRRARVISTATCMKTSATMKAKRSSHCIRGHEYTLENAYTNTRGWRRCVTCANDLRRTRRQRLQAERTGD